MDAREVVVIITGAHKALAMHKCIERCESHVDGFCDSDASAIVRGGL